MKCKQFRHLFFSPNQFNFLSVDREKSARLGRSTTFTTCYYYLLITCITFLGLYKSVCYSKLLLSQMLLRKPAGKSLVKYAMCGIPKQNFELKVSSWSSPNIKYYNSNIFVWQLIRISRLIEREEKMHPNTKASMNVTKYKEVRIVQWECKKSSKE